MQNHDSGTSQHRWGIAEPAVPLREFLRVSGDSERRLRRELAVNPTDVSAMERLIQSGLLSHSEMSCLGVTTAAAPTIADRLARVGHVSRHADEQDRRGVLEICRAHARAEDRA